MTNGVAMPAVGERAGDGPKLVPRARRLEPELGELAAAVPDPRDGAERGDAERAAAGAIRRDQRLEEVDLVLVAHPVLVEILERVEEPGRGELRDPDRIEDREIGRTCPRRPHG